MKQRKNRKAAQIFMKSVQRGARCHNGRCYWQYDQYRMLFNWPIFTTFESDRPILPQLIQVKMDPQKVNLWELLEQDFLQAGCPPWALTKSLEDYMHKASSIPLHISFPGIPCDPPLYWSVSINWLFASVTIWPLHRPALYARPWLEGQTTTHCLRNKTKWSLPISQPSCNKSL